MTTAAEEKSKKLSEIFPTPKGTKINWYSYFGIIVARDFSVEIQVGTDRVMTTIFSDDQRLLGAYFSYSDYVDLEDSNESSPGLELSIKEMKWKGAAAQPDEMQRAMQRMMAAIIQHAKDVLFHLPPEPKKGAKVSQLNIG